MKNFGYILTGLYLGLILCISECLFFVFTEGKKLNTQEEIVILLFIANTSVCVYTVKVLQLDIVSKIIDKHF